MDEEFRKIFFKMTLKSSVVSLSCLFNSEQGFYISGTTIKGHIRHHLEEISLYSHLGEYIFNRIFISDFYLDNEQQTNIEERFKCKIDGITGGASNIFSDVVLLKGIRFLGAIYLPFEIKMNSFEEEIVFTSLLQLEKINRQIQVKFERLD